MNETFHLSPNENILTIARIKSFIICFISNSLNFGAQVAQNVPLDQFFGKFIKTMFYENLILQQSMYADDHQLYSSNETVEDSAKMLEKNGKITSDRYKANYLEENLSTYQVMMMTKGKIDISKIDIDNQVLAQMKLLGATLDKELNFSNHVLHIFKNTSKRIRFFTRLRKLISTTTKLHIYKAALMPYFNDGRFVWHFKSNDRNKLQRKRSKSSSLL